MKLKSNFDSILHLLSMQVWISLKSLFHVNSKEILKLINQSEFAIITPSVMVYEIPFLTIKTADNQDDVYTYLKHNNYSTLESWNETKFKQCMKI